MGRSNPPRLHIYHDSCRPDVDDMEDVLLAWFRASRDRQFLLMIAGRLSGIHGWKRTHIPVAYQVTDTTTIIHFDGSEYLTVSDAADASIGPNGELFIGNASEVRFTWRSEKDSSKECEEILSKVGRVISFSRKDDLYTTTGIVFGRSSDGKLIALRQE